MKKRWGIVLGIVVLLVGCSVALLKVAQHPQQEQIVLKTQNSCFTDENIRARIDLICRKYGMTSEELYEDPGFWNQTVNDIIFDYAGSEIARNILENEGIAQLNEEQLEQADMFADSLLSDIESIGEDPASYLGKLGFTQQSLATYAQNQIYESLLQKQWAQEIQEPSQDSVSFYQELLYYTKCMWDEINARVECGEIMIDTSTLLQENDLQ